MDWKELVGKVAPTLGAALGGPFGGMAGSFLADKLGVEEKDLEETVLAADPDEMAAIKQADAEFKVKMRELDIKEADLHARDRASARDMAQATSVVPQITQSVMYDLAFILVCYFVFTSGDSFGEVQKSIIMYLMGILSAGLVQVNNFWFGSSSGSKEKNKLKV